MLASERAIRLTVVHRVAEEHNPLALVVGELDVLELAVLDEGALESAGLSAVFGIGYGDAGRVRGT